eukprot:Gb_05474 [translate_table: standard]
MDAMAAYQPPQPPPTQPNPYYPFPPPQHFPPPQFYAAPPAPYPAQYQPFQEEVRTLFMAGLPEDVKYREIYNLFREFPGYLSCQLKRSGKGSQVYAFSVFTDQQSALAAMHALNDMEFDPETGAVLHIDLAKANSRPKRSRTDDGGSSSFDKRIRGPISIPGIYPDAAVG